MGMAVKPLEPIVDDSTDMRGRRFWGRTRSNAELSAVAAADAPALVMQSPPYCTCSSLYSVSSRLRILVAVVERLDMQHARMAADTAQSRYSETRHEADHSCPRR